MSSAEHIPGAVYDSFDRRIIGRNTGSILDGGKPHPRSYRPDLPMRPMNDGQILQWASSFTRKYERELRRGVPKWLQTRMPKKAAPRPTHPYSANKPHARGYRPDLPLRPLTCKQLQALTAEDRAYYKAHPLRFVAGPGPVDHDNYTAFCCRGDMPGHRHGAEPAAKLEALRQVLNIVDD